MYASGSTWLYNATRDVAARLYPELPVSGLYAEGVDALSRLPGGLTVVKTHHLPPPAARLMLGRAERIMLSLRDPRDAVTSLMQHMGQSFLQALHWVEDSALFCARHAADTRTALFIYETGFTETPTTFDLLGTALGGTLTETARAELFAATRREAIEAKIARLRMLPTSWRNPATGDLLDRDTQWHRHHAGRSGEVGRWRRLLPPEGAQTIERRLGGFMRDFGYLP
jgi:hypothetical protein